MKLLNLAAISLASALALGSSLLLSGDRVAPALEHNNTFRHASQWAGESFDEAVWRAVDEVAALEETIAPEVELFFVELRPAEERFQAVQLAFDRESLLRLIAGELAPETFVRDHIKFD